MLPTYSKNLLVPCRAGLKVRGQNLCAISRKKVQKMPKVLLNLLNNKRLHHKMKTIRSHKHQLGSYEINKVSLSCFDDKHYIHNNGISSYAYGHYKI